jgi:transposase InsO family protein
VGRDRFADIVDWYGLKVRARVRKPGTTDSTHGLPFYPLEALGKALKRVEEQEDSHLIHHSDSRGFQYAGREYVSLLKHHGIRISMTGSGDSKENAQAERINGTMKNELLRGAVFHSLEEVTSAVRVAVDFYNQ